MFGQLHPFLVGDFSTLSAWENDQESKVYDMIEMFEDKYKYKVITAYDVDAAMEHYGIDYPNLPQFLKDEIDTINIV